MVTRSSQTPLVIAHRGASGLAPENTMAAFRLAIAMGAHGVELDVHLSADKLPVVIHDGRVDRTTDARGPVSHMTARELDSLDAGKWFMRRLAMRPRVRALVSKAASPADTASIDFSGEGVPRLEAALDLLARADLARVYVELKGSPSTRALLLDCVISLVRSRGAERLVTLLSFDHEIIKRAKSLAPEIRAAATFPIAGRALATPRSILRQTESVSADEAALHFSLATRRTIAALHEAGLEASAWTVNSQLVMRRLIASRIDAIMTNFPNRLIGVIQSRA